MALSDAQQDAVDALRPLIGMTDLDDDALSRVITGKGGDLDAAAAEVWRQKSSNAADLVDVKEGSSSRPLSQLRGAYSAQADLFEARAERGAAGGGPTVSRFRRLTRGDR